MGAKGKAWESLGERYQDQQGKHRDDKFAPLFESLAQSDAFRDLNYRQRLLYMVCRFQIGAKYTPYRDHAEDIDGITADCFYLPCSLVWQYGMYSGKSPRSMDSRTFAKDMRVLEDHGFIKIISNGKASRQKSIYTFSPDWKHWQRPP